MICISFLAPIFTRDPEKLRGERIQCQLVKSPHSGIGIRMNAFEDEDGSEDEFLRIEAILPNTPAHEEGSLKIGQCIIELIHIMTPQGYFRSGSDRVQCSPLVRSF